MAFPEDASEIRAQGWRTLALFHDLISAELEVALRDNANLSVVEYTLLDVLNRQVGEHHMRMQQVARATALSRSATTRLVARMEDRGLLTRYICDDDRRGIYTELTDAGSALLEEARPCHDAALGEALRKAEDIPELRSLARNFDGSLQPSS